MMRAPALIAIAIVLSGLLAAPARVGAQQNPPAEGEEEEGDAAEGDDGSGDDDDWDEEEGEQDEGDGDAQQAEPERPQQRQTQPAGDDDDDWDEEEEEEEGEEEEEAPEDEPLGGDTTSWVQGGPPAATDEDSTLVIPPLFLRMTRGDTTTTAVFPLFFQEESPDDLSRMIFLYYYRRSLEENADVLFPLYWSFRGVDSLTFSIPPVYYHYDDDGFDWGIAPLIFDGRSGDSVYTIIPPLLTFSYADEDEAYTLATIFWRYREREAVRWGIFPLVWDLATELNRDTFALPFFFRFSDYETENVLTVVPPVYHEEDPEHALFGVAPLFHHYHDATGSSLTLPPLLFHYGNFDGDVRLFNPLFLYFDVDDERTFLTWLYQRHRGATELDAVAPFVFSYRDPREHYSSLVIPPLLWTFSGPASTNTVVFPFFGYFHEPGLFSTYATLLTVHNVRHDEDAGFTWIFPTIQLEHDPDKSIVNFHPLLYSRNEEEYRHLVIAPIHWDFEWRDEDYRATVDFPIFWRFRSGPEVKQVLLNTYYREYEEDGASGWEFHFFPLFAFGKPRPSDHWWSILYGLVGYRRQGSYGQTRLFWIPFQTDGPD